MKGVIDEMKSFPALSVNILNPLSTHPQFIAIFLFREHRIFFFENNHLTIQDCVDHKSTLTIPPFSLPNSQQTETRVQI